VPQIVGEVPQIVGEASEKVPQIVGETPQIIKRGQLVNLLYDNSTFNYLWRNNGKQQYHQK